MVRRFKTVLCVLAVSNTALADDAAPAPPASAVSAPASPIETFESLRLLGDLHQLAGRNLDAALAYARALALRDDPRVAGRLGVLLVKFGRYEDAAEKLIDAIQLATDATSAERKAFTEAFEKTLSQGAWVHVSLSHAGAQVKIDDVPKNGPGRSAFYTFVMAGEHVVQAHLDGYEDVTVSFTAQKRKEARVSITFVALPMPDAPTLPPVTVEEPAKPKPRRSSPAATPMSTSGLPKQEDPWGYPDPVPEEPKEDDGKGFHGALFAGPVVLFGVASWMPAVGGMIGGAWKPKQYFSLGLEARAAWLTVGVGGEPVNAMTAGGLLSACGHVKWFYGCALGHLGVTNVAFSKETFAEKTYSNFMPGVGGRVGATVRFTRSLSGHASVDALVFDSGISVSSGGHVIAEQPPVMVGVRLGTGWEF